MRTFLSLFILTVILLTSVASAKPLKKVEIWCNDDIYQDYLKFLYGRSPLSIEDYSGSFSRRDVVELVLLQQLIVAGGYPARFELNPTLEKLDRIVTELGQGLDVVPGSTFFESDMKGQEGNIFISAPIIRKDEFIVAVYMLAEHPQRNRISSLEDLRRLVGITGKSWHRDQEILNDLGVKNIMAPNWEMANYMLEQGRADFVLQPLSAEDGYVINAFKDVMLLPSEGVSVSFPNSRHFVLSKQPPANKALYQALNKGIALFRKEGRIQKAYVESGFLQPVIFSWKDLRRQNNE